MLSKSGESFMNSDNFQPKEQKQSSFFKRVKQFFE
mgnify:CR=1 FL=1